MYSSPVRHSPPTLAGRAAVRLACVRHAASVQAEPGSNSSVETCRSEDLCSRKSDPNQKNVAIELLSFFGAPLLLGRSSSTRRPHKSPAHAVKDRSRLAAPDDVSSPAGQCPREPRIIRASRRRSTPLRENFSLQRNYCATSLTRAIPRLPSWTTCS